MSPSDTIDVQFTREALEALISMWNANDVRRSTGEIIRLSYHQYSPGWAVIETQLITEYEQDRDDYAREAAIEDGKLEPHV